jgi:toxin ParE1/3/4
MAQYRISNAARADIVDVLRHSNTQFGEQARQRYQKLILTALQFIAATPHHVVSHARDEITPGLRSYHLIHSRQNAKYVQAAVKEPRHIVCYRVADNEVIEIVRLLQMFLYSCT